MGGIKAQSYSLLPVPTRLRQGLPSKCVKQAVRYLFNAPALGETFLDIGAAWLGDGRCVSGKRYTNAAQSHPMPDHGAMCLLRKRLSSAAHEVVFPTGQ